MQLKKRDIREALRRRVLVLDGAMGTAIQNRNLTPMDFGGEALDGCNENLILTRPDVLESIHREYLEAGCDVLETNTFGGTPMVLAEYGLQNQAHEINFQAAKLAQRLCEDYSTPDWPRFVAGSIGPTTKALSVTGGTTYDELLENFYVQARALIEGGVDYLLIETAQDTRNVRAALDGIDRAQRELGTDLPIAVSGTIEPMGTMLGGQTIEALLTSVEHRNLLYIGLNCATGPEFMTDPVRALSRISKFPISCVPNAGLPDENGHYLETPEMVGTQLERFVREGWVQVIGGCCGTHAGHIRKLHEIATRTPLPARTPPPPISRLSGLEYLEITPDLRPVLVGERTNVIGSKKFKELIAAEKFEEASEIARLQVKSGAQILDVCLANPDRDELQDMERFLEKVIQKIKIPLMIDSTDEKVIERALTYSQGKAIINSINLEDGLERFEKVVPIAKRFGAAMVVGCIDEDPLQGMGVTRQRKLKIARRSYRILTEDFGVAPEDIYWDPLVFPCATGDEQYVGSAVETIEGVRLIKEAFPRTKTILGISNVSFGLPAHGREVLNSVFLYECVKAGLDLAIVNSEKLVRYASISEGELQLARNLLWNIRETPETDPIAAFAAHFREKKPVDATKKMQLPLEERLPRYIIEGTKEGLIADLELALQSMRPLEIINGPLMKGMDEVGRLFNQNQLIVAEVLQSAESMKAAVAHLERYMEKTESSSRGKVVLATVKGDVHDIGKNLVEIILSNNGFQVVNLGIKIPPEQLIQAVREHRPDMVGLSGLLVKSAQQMVITAQDFSEAGIATPVLVGGAALSQGFVDKQIAKAYRTGTVAYAKDAMSGLDLAKTIVDPEKFEQLKIELRSRREALELEQPLKRETPSPVAESTLRSPSLRILERSEIPRPPDLKRHVLRDTPLPTIWKYLNPLMLYGRHLGIKGGMVREIDQKKGQVEDEKARSVYLATERIKDLCMQDGLLNPRAVFQFFPAYSSGNRLNLEGSEGVFAFDFPRQRSSKGLCLSDYTLPTPHQDHVALFVVTAGSGVRERATELKDQGDYLASHILQALALETAEAYAEYLHSQLRRMWGFPDPNDMTMMERFQAKYRGKRYSFGYPACPRLDDQAALFQALRAKEIGVELTEGFMMDPEASVSAIVFHHPEATYFSVGDQDENRT